MGAAALACATIARGGAVRDVRVSVPGSALAVLSLAITAGGHVRACVRYARGPFDVPQRAAFSG